MSVRKSSVIASALLLLPAVAWGQVGGDTNPSIQDESEIGTVNEMDKGGDSVMKKYDNNLDYGGFKSSPILTDTRTPEGYRQRVYPELSSLPASLGAMAAYDTTGEADGRTDLSVDDEINKAAKAVFQFKGDIENSFLKDTKARDRFLDIYTKERGIAILTLSYLDKTVAAGLATAQAQSDSDVSHAILQQVSWNQDKIANPQRAHLYDDVDEKFERCMVAYFKENGIVGGGGGKPSVLSTQPNIPNIVNYADIFDGKGTAPAGASKICLDRVGGREFSPYHFCNCVASMSRNANAGSWSKSGADKYDAETGPIWSLVDRTFKGLRTPKGWMEVPASADIPDASWWPEDAIYAADQIVQFADNFRAMYGDVVMYRGRRGKIPVPKIDKTDDETDVQQDPADDEIRIRYMPPQMSVPNWIRALRDRQVPDQGSTKLTTCQNCALPGNSDLSVNRLQYCPITGGMVNHGICPSLRALVLLAKYNQIETWRTQAPTSNEYRALHDFWVEASLGAVINAKNLMDMVSMSDITYSDDVLVDLTTADLDFNPTGLDDIGGVQESNDKWQAQNPRLRRFVESYCDAAAINAFKKLHLRMMSIAADHLMLNRKLSQLDREQIQALMNRVTLYLELGNEDSRQPTDQMLVALGNEADRRDVAQTAAATQSFLASIDNQTQESEIHMFGGNMAPTIAPTTP